MQNTVCGGNKRNEQKWNDRGGLRGRRVNRGFGDRTRSKKNNIRTQAVARQRAAHARQV